MLINKCYLKDIREWEETNNKNILDLLNNVSMTNLIMLVSIFNKNMNEDTVYETLETYFENNSIIDAFIEIKNSLLGYKEEKVINEDGEAELVDEDYYEDITEYKTMTDFYMHLCNHLMSLGISYSEFWSFTTKEMYQVFNSIEQKKILDFNQHMQEYHLLAGMVAGAMWGKPLKEPPMIKKESDDSKLIDTPHGQMTVQEYRELKQFMKL